MTVLAKYQRLETEAIWRPDKEAQRRDVIVSIGKATLTISTANGTALTHWSLPAIARLNPGETPALYAPGQDAPETVEVADNEMIGAIEQVLRAVRQGSEEPSKLRSITMALIALGALAALVFWVPGAITRYTASLVPDAAKSSIGASLLAEMQRVTGAPCAEPIGANALKALESRLFPSGATTLVVVPSAISETAELPGGAILIGRALVEDFETPEVLAGYLMAADARRDQAQPLSGLLEVAGLRASLSLLTTAELPDTTLPRMAEWLAARAPMPAEEDALLSRLSSANIDSAPYAYAIDISGESTSKLIAASQPTSPPLLSDGQWIALQGICGE
ncbi:MAG: hypothetical protein HKN27_11245 [Silicimonas sp.]|nr:hypothetical protein [Silicimonas sp.]